MSNFSRIQRKIPIDLRLIPLVLFGVLLIVFVFFVPPQIFTVIIFILICTGLTFFVSSYFVNRKYQILATVFVFLFMIMTYLAGFEMLNTLLLVSFIIGLAKLL